MAMRYNYKCANKNCEKYSETAKCLVCDRDGVRLVKEFRCDCCGEVIDPEKLYDVDGEMLCEDCIKENLSDFFDKIDVEDYLE